LSRGLKTSPKFETLTCCAKNSADGTNIEKGKRQGTTAIEDGRRCARLLRSTKGGPMILCTRQRRRFQNRFSSEMAKMGLLIVCMRFGAHGIAIHDCYSRYTRLLHVSHTLSLYTTVTRTLSLIAIHDCYTYSLSLSLSLSDFHILHV